MTGARLITRIVRMDPRAFERLSVRLFREAGFINVTTTPGSNDEGIDAVGVYRVSLLSFPVYVQCKRYKGSVGPDKVRDFRGAMAGRGDKGLLITTANFTKSAKDEATRDGATPIDLVDGERLVRPAEAVRAGGLGEGTDRGRCDRPPRVLRRHLALA